jgi:hypothetical protein
MTKTINILAPKTGSKEITPQLDLGIAKDTDLGEIGMGVLSDGTPYLNQRGLAALCGVQNAHIGTISSQWNEQDEKPRIKSIKAILEKVGYSAATAHIEVLHKGQVHFCYPAEVCLAILEYYAFDAGANCQPQARDNFRTLAGSKLRDLIYAQVGYDPSGSHTHKFDKWHERIALNFQSAPNGLFHVFNEAHTIVYELIMAGADIGENFIVDISIGMLGRNIGRIETSRLYMASALNGLIAILKAILSRNPIRKSHGVIRSPFSATTGNGSNPSTLMVESSRII